MNKLRCINGIVPFTSTKTYLIVFFLLFICIPSFVGAAIRFEDVSKQSGVYNLFSTAASAWGDLNGDGWPDLWVSNHWHQPPSIYLNQQDGTFRDIAADILVADLPADFHGAAWADFDNDGDQDLFVTTGGGAGLGNCPNYFFINDGGKLLDEANRLGVQYPLGRGRTPLWLDADGDGKLDLLLMNRDRAGDKAPSAIFLQTTNNFVSSSGRLNFKSSGVRSRLEKVTDLLSNAIHLKWRKGPGQIKVAEKFAQLADFSGDHSIDLASYVKPVRVYSISNTPFKGITNNIGFPSVSGVRDIAIEDFDGDQKVDMFLVRSNPGTEVVQVDLLRLQGKAAVPRGSGFITVAFRSKGQVTFNLFSLWVDPSDQQTQIPVVAIGNHPPLPLDGRSIILDPRDPSLQKTISLPEDKGVSIEYDPGENVWRLRSSLSKMNFIITSTEQIDQIKTIGIKTSKGDLTDHLLLRNSEGFKFSRTSGFADRRTACSSVVAGDFDNDMDMDLYLACSGPAQNLANILYENDGAGHFIEVPDAGGAMGSEQGRSNQVVLADYDKDGFLDLFVTNGAGQPPIAFEGPHQLFHNKGNENHWIEIDLEGTISNLDAIGSIIELDAGGVLQIRSQSGGMHSFSQNHQRIHFGLGQNLKADRIIIRWPSGILQELTDVKADQILQVSEPASVEN